MKHIRTLEWKNGRIRIINQAQLPRVLGYVGIDDIGSLWQAIKSMKIRGAPALGAAAGLGIYLGIKDSRAKNFTEFSRELKRLAAYIASCRPTARNLFWGIERVLSAALKNKDKPLPAIKKLILKEAEAIIQEDRKSCRKIGYYGRGVIRNNDAVLTICNAGILATIDYGTALGVIYRAQEDGKKVRVFACETRPMLQGARLTTWELRRKGIEVTLICDNMAATLMRQGKIDKVIAGADRIAANGDTANKIGTYNLAILAHYHRIPFYIAAPGSTFDLSLKSGKHIPIEQRPAEEVTKLFFKKPIISGRVKVYNPAFDLTPAGLITAFITDKGIIYPDYAGNIAKALARQERI